MTSETEQLTDSRWTMPGAGVLAATRPSVETDLPVGATTAGKLPARCAKLLRKDDADSEILNRLLARRLLHKAVTHARINLLYVKISEVAGQSTTSRERAVAAYVAV